MRLGLVREAARRHRRTGWGNALVTAFERGPPIQVLTHGFHSVRHQTRLHTPT